MPKDGRVQPCTRMVEHTGHVARTIRPLTHTSNTRRLYSSRRYCITTVSTYDALFTERGYVITEFVCLPSRKETNRFRVHTTSRQHNLVR